MNTKTKNKLREIEREVKRERFCRKEGLSNFWTVNSRGYVFKCKRSVATGWSRLRKIDGLDFAIYVSDFS